MLQIAEAHAEPSQTYKMELFTGILNDRKPLKIFAKSFILDIWLGSDYATELSYK